MSRKKIYSVSYHTFSLKMDAASPLWERLDNNTPFIVNKCDEKALIFTLTVVGEKENPDGESLTSVGDFDGAGACLKLFYAADGGRVFRISHQNQDTKHAFYLHIASDYHCITKPPPVLPLGAQLHIQEVLTLQMARKR